MIFMNDFDINEYILMFNKGLDKLETLEKTSKKLTVILF
jgi:hypothetical protein